MKTKIISCLFPFFLIGWEAPLTFAQSAEDYFNRAARQYVNNDIPGTGQLLAEGLAQYPTDPKLNALNEKLKKDQEDEDQNQQNQDQQDQQDQQNQEEQEGEEQKDGEGEEQANEDQAGESEENEDRSGEKSQQEEPAEESSDMESDLSEREKAMEDMRQRLEDMNITPEQAAQILDAMNNAELRYIQQNQKKPTQRPDKNMPDW